MESSCSEPCLEPTVRQIQAYQVTPDPTEYECCFRLCDVHFSTFLIGHIGIISSIVAALLVLIVDERLYGPCLCVAFIITGLSYLALMIGNRMKNQVIYAAHLIVTGVSILVVYVLSLTMVKQAVHENLSQPSRGLVDGTLVVGVIAIGTATMFTYFWVIVYWDYNYLGQLKMIRHRNQLVKHVFVLF